VVFTLPETIAATAYQNKAVVYDILFHATAETLRKIAATPKHLGAEIGFIVLLHTWGQNLQYHPHVHCVVPGGGLSADGERWVACRPGFFWPVRVRSRLFRRLFLEQLQEAFDAGQLQFFNALEALVPMPLPGIWLRYDKSIGWFTPSHRLAALSMSLSIWGVIRIGCPKCGHGHMICVETFLPRGPPGAYS
jgi:hypothetical protein